MTTLLVLDCLEQAIWSYGDGNTASAPGFCACPFTFRGR